MKLSQLLIIGHAALSIAQTAIATPQDVQAGAPMLSVHAKTSQQRDEASTVTAYFASDSAKLMPAARAALDPLVHQYRYSNKHHFHLGGYSDVRGPRDHNMLLSRQRVSAVKSYLIDRGVRPERIKIDAYGESRAAINVNDSRALVYDRKVLVRVIRPASKPARFARLGGS